MLSEHGIRFSRTSSFATGSASLTVAGVAGSRHFITDISASGDRGTAVLTIKDNATIVYAQRPGSTVPFTQHLFTPLEISAGSAIVAKIDAEGTAYINVQGFTL